MGDNLTPLEPEKPPVIAVVEDLCGIAASKLRDDYVHELMNWALLGRDVARYLLDRQLRP